MWAKSRSWPLDGKLARAGIAAAIRNGGLPAKFKNVMLADADVDVDVFRSQIADMGTHRPGFTLFVSRDDRALAASKRVWGNVDRLGAIDPQQSPYKEELIANATQVCGVTGGRPIDRHSAGERADLDDSHVGLGDTILSATTETAARLGTGIGLAVAAPVALVDQGTRNNYGKHVQSLSGTTTGAGTPAIRKTKCKADNSGNRPCA
jgi:esterase/lipase superfamily enzyme